MSKILKTGLTSKLKRDKIYTVGFPLAVAKHMNLKEGDEIEYCINIKNNDVVLKKFKN